MLQYIVAGLALGSIYAIASSALVVTFVSAGVLNFGFGAIAFFIARFYYWLNTQHQWPSSWAAIVSLLVVAPLLGMVLYLGLFRFIRDKSMLVKLVVTIGLLVAIPTIADTIFGALSQRITGAPGLANPSDSVYHILGAPITNDQVITIGFLVFIVIVGTLVLQFTSVGLRVRAMVDSEAMSSLSGTNPGRVSLGVWAVTASLTGLAGILIAPSQGLNVGAMTTLMVASFAAVVVARLRSLPVAVVAALAMGVVTDGIQRYLPADSSLTAAIIPSIPFGFILLTLLFYVVRAGTIKEASSGGGPLDHAIRPANRDPIALAEAPATGRRWEAGLGAIPLVIVLALPLIFHGSPYWLGLIATGLAYAIFFLSFTLVTGEGGMLWLSQIIFAGIGGLGTAQFVNTFHMPVLLAMVISAVIAAIVGAIIGVLTIRLGDLYVALVTFSFGLLIETLVFTRQQFLQGGAGLSLTPPSFAGSDFAFSYFALGAFLIFALLIWNLRHSTGGLALRAVRDSEPASRSLGISVVQVKVIIASLASFVAAVGGTFIAMNQQIAQPQYFETFAGLAMFAVCVTMGVRSITAAALAGLSFSLVPGVFQTYLPARWGEVPTMLFGLGAVGIATNPDGIVTMHARQIRSLLRKALAQGPRPSGSYPMVHEAAWLGSGAEAVATGLPVPDSSGQYRSKHARGGTSDASAISGASGTSVDETRE